jgi:acetylornithine deacetylase/succinyl-diaminopimelate desuccinylase-like protein
VCFGPGRIEEAHTVDEHVPVHDLVDVAKTLAVTALRFCADPVDLSR